MAFIRDGVLLSGYGADFSVVQHPDLGEGLHYCTAISQVVISKG